MKLSGASPMGTPELSVVVPVYNEADNLEALVARLVPVLERVASSHEIVFIDDGSSDASMERLREIHARDARRLSCPADEVRSLDDPGEADLDWIESIAAPLSAAQAAVEAAAQEPRVPIVDRDAGRVLVARDPIGVVPLYWGHDAQGRLRVAAATSVGADGFDERSADRDEIAEIAFTATGLQSGLYLTNLVVNGGTGIALRDRTYEAVTGLLEKLVDAVAAAGTSVLVGRAALHRRVGGLSGLDG